MASLADASYALQILEHKVLAYGSEREGGFAGVLQSAADAEFAQVCAVVSGRCRCTISCCI